MVLRRRTSSSALEIACLFEPASRQASLTCLTRRINMILSTTLFIERGFFTVVGGFFGLGYPIRDMQASMRFSLASKFERRIRR